MVQRKTNQPNDQPKSPHETAKSWGQHTRNAYEESWVFKVFVWVVLVSLAAALVYVAWLNIGPYVLLVKNMGGGENWLSNFPLIGWLVKVWSTTVSTIIGLLIWALVQSLQCLWILIGLDRQAMKGAVAQAQVARFNLPTGADSTAQRLERKSRRIPYFFIRWGALLSLGAYTFDLVVGVGLYPPARSLDRFLFALSSGMWSAINLSNLGKLLLMLFAFEFTLVLFIVVVQWVRTRNYAAKLA